MTNNNLSRLLAYILRHRPDEFNITLDDQGWVSVNLLIQQINSIKNELVTFEQLLEVVRTCNKKRYEFDDLMINIRACQGHSIDIDINFPISTPPPILYHGTSSAFVNSILVKGLLKQERNYVHLTDNFDTAIAVGNRHKSSNSKTVVFVINTNNIALPFRLSNNNVWLIDHIPVVYLTDIKIIHS